SLTSAAKLTHPPSGTSHRRRDSAAGTSSGTSDARVASRARVMPLSERNGGRRKSRRNTPDKVASDGSLRNRQRASMSTPIRSRRGPRCPTRSLRPENGPPARDPSARGRSCPKPFRLPRRPTGTPPRVRRDVRTPHGGIPLHSEDADLSSAHTPTPPRG